MIQGLGTAIGIAVEGAMLGQAIGDAYEQAEASMQKAQEWRNYAKQLEKKVDILSKNINAVQEEKSKIEGELAEANRGNRILYSVIKDESDGKIGTLKRAQQYKNRLSQVEKALRYSSANAESLKIILEPYKALVARLNLEGELPPDIEAKADEIWRKHIEGESLTNDANVQEILDANPLPARPPKSMNV